MLEVENLLELRSLTVEAVEVTELSSKVAVR